MYKSLIAALVSAIFITPAVHAAAPFSIKITVDKLQWSAPSNGGSSGESSGVGSSGGDSTEPSNSAVSISPNAPYQFPDIFINQEAVASFTILNNSGAASATGLSVLTSGTGFSIESSSCGTSLPAGQSCPVIVKFSAGSYGVYSGDLVVSSTNGSPVSTSVGLSGTALTPPNLQVSPSGSLAFGEVPTGASSSITLVLSNTSNTSVLTGVSVDVTGSSEFTLSNNSCGTPSSTSPIPADSTCSVTVIFSPSSATGEAIGSVHLGSSANSIVVPLSATRSGPSAGQVAFTTPGSYSWTVPAGVTSVSSVVVGGGGSACGVFLGSAAVYAGSSSFGTYAVATGGAVGVSNANWATAVGGVKQVGTGGGSGGDSIGGGGGGAGGYAGKGGNGTTGYSGYPSGAGGGVGIFGQGLNGIGGVSVSGNAVDAGGIGTGGGGGGGSGGSGWGGSGYRGTGGSNGLPASSTTNRTPVGIGAGAGGGANCGGGGGGGLAYSNNIAVTPGSTISIVVGAGATLGLAGAPGAVRVIWPGDSRQFPSTRTADE